MSKQCDGTKLTSLPRPGRIPETKSGEPVTLALPPAAMTILQTRKVDSSSEWVFPGKGATEHLMEPKTAWKRIIARAGIKDLRIHDLRRTLGSWQAAAGSSLPIIGKSLGHKSLGATQIYARLNLDPVRASVNKATGGNVAGREHARRFAWAAAMAKPTEPVLYRPWLPSAELNQVLDSYDTRKNSNRCRHRKRISDVLRDPLIARLLTTVSRNRY